MKKYVVLFVLCISYISAYAQMTGGFSYGNDGRLYLFLQNQSGYALTFRGSVYSPLRRDGNSETCTVYPGTGLYLGPTTPWRWQWCEGDRYTITYPNGTTQTWTCPTNDYKGFTTKGKHCNGIVGCSCPGFSPITNAEVWKQEYCKHCGHKKSCHK